MSSCWEPSLFEGEREKVEEIRGGVSGRDRFYFIKIFLKEHSVLPCHGYIYGTGDTVLN